MKPTLLVSLLFLLLFVETQGFRLEHEYSSIGDKRIHEVKESNLIEARNGGFGAVVLCRDGYCSGRSRKLMTKTISSSSTSTTTTTTSSKDSSTTSKNAKSGGTEALKKNKETFFVKSSPVSDHREVASERYPDAMDIAGMDYSPARRKPPIHN